MTDGALHVLMRAAGVRVMEDDVGDALRFVPDERLHQIPTELADAIEWHRPATDADVEREIAASRASRSVKVDDLANRIGRPAHVKRPRRVVL